MTPLHFLIFLFAIAFLLGFVQVGLLTIAFDKLGLSQGAAFTLLFTSLIGSMINLPLFQVRAHTPPNSIIPQLPVNIPAKFKGRVIISLNVGGGLIPILFSLYLMDNHPLALYEVIPGIATVAAICYTISRPVPGLGIAMPIFIAPISAAMIALLISPQYSAPLAYICGTLGVLIGADIFRIRDIQRMGTPFAAIGGAGTFDGIFITGIVAVLLA